MSLRCRPPRTFDALHLNDVVGRPLLTHAGGITDHASHTAQIQRHLDNISRRTSDRTDNGGVAIAQQIQKRRLARVGRADDAYPQPVSGDLPPHAVRQVSVHPVGQILHARYDVAPYAQPAISLVVDVVHVVGVQIFVVAKVNHGLGMGQAAGEVRAPPFVQSAETTVELSQGLFALEAGIGRDEIGQGLHLGQIELAPSVGSLGELSAIGRSEAVGCGHGGVSQCVEYAPNDGTGAMAVYLDDVFPCKGSGSRKGENEGRIELVGIVLFGRRIIFDIATAKEIRARRSGIPKRPQTGHPRLGHLDICQRLSWLDQ